MRISSTPRALMALIAALALFVAACGSDEAETATDPEPTPAADGGDDTADDTADELPTDDDAGDAATSGLADDDAGDEATSEVVDPPPGAGDFCSLYAENLNLIQEFDFFDPVQVEQWIGTSVGLLDQAIADAPGEIQADLEIVRADFDALVDTLEEYDYDFFAASEAVDAITDTAEVDAATDRIDAYVESTCGIDVDAVQDQAAEDLLENSFDSILGNETLLAEIVAGMTEDGEMTEDQATCLLENLDTDLLAGLAADGGAAAMSDPDVLAGLFGTFATCGIDLG